MGARRSWNWGRQQDLVVYAPVAGILSCVGVAMAMFWPSGSGIQLGFLTWAYSKAPCSCLADAWALKSLPYHGFGGYVATRSLWVSKAYQVWGVPGQEWTKKGL